MKKNRGITLIELLVIIAIVGILISVIISALHPNKSHACAWWDSCDSNSTQLDDLHANQAKLVAAVPMPTITNSLERKNIAARAVLFDSPDKISYVYLLSFGKVMAFYTAKGKVSSLRSYMSPQEQIVNGDGSPCYGSATGCVTVEAPDIDGSYGDNVDGIFFFTTEGAYVEWKGDYMMSDQPLQLSTQPELIRTVK